MNKWISVKDRLPETRITVNVYGWAGGSAGYIDSLGTWWNQSTRGFANDKEVSHDITHWQPLPKPPTKLTKPRNNACNEKE